ncbi:uncharacterized protein CEXT_115981 [Caerostris extrusa]|uniref:Uncharacterized protein n=1 Tax=Caerostris extrusa TaxID=172846 RepID=A0AAV4YGV2_CAEEX|nr:uncharacterized protein CEXT_115981 [Caerostris extrusa]
MAEESSYSEEISRELPDQNTSFSRKRKSSTESFALKPDEMLSQNMKQNSKRKGNRTPHVLRDNDESENPPQFRKSHQSELADMPPKTANAISNRNGRISGPVRNSNQFSKDTSQQQEFDHRINIDPHSIQHDVRPQREQSKMNKIPNSIQQSHSLQNQGNDAYQVHIGSANQKKRNYNLHPASQNLPPSHIQQQQLHKSQPHLTEQQRMASHQTQPQPGRQLFHHPPPILGTTHHSSPGTGSQSLPSQHHKKYQPPEFRQPLAPQTNPPFPHPAVQPQSYPAPPPLSPNQGPVSNSFSNTNMQKIANPHPLDLQNNGPQYFAPPPQTFHTKTSYDRPSGLSKLPSLSSYERVAQSTVDHSKDGLHHHHHHHHHHEPLSSNSDPIGDVNLSDVPRTNDADRLGTIGIGFGGGGGGGGGGGFGGGGARGITVQIGGGGGGMTGLIPLGALGIAKNIVASLLPRPTLGLNSKVYLGVEVGRGGLGLLG